MLLWAGRSLVILGGAAQIAGVLLVFWQIRDTETREGVPRWTQDVSQRLRGWASRSLGWLRRELVDLAYLVTLRPRPKPPARTVGVGGVAFGPTFSGSGRARLSYNWAPDATPQEALIAVRQDLDALWSEIDYVSQAAREETGSARAEARARLEALEARVGQIEARVRHVAVGGRAWQIWAAVLIAGGTAVGVIGSVLLTTVPPPPPPT